MPSVNPRQGERELADAHELLTRADVPTRDDAGRPLSLALRIGVLMAQRDDALDRVAREVQ